MQDRFRNRRGLRRWALTLMMVALMAFVATGCESGGDDEPANNSGSSSSESSGTKAEDLGVANGGELLHVDESAIPDVGAKKIGIIPICAQCTGMARFIDSFETLGKEKGWKVTVTDSGGDTAKIVSAFNTFIQSKVDAIVLGALDPTALGQQIKAANDADIPVIVNEGAWVPGTVFACCQHPTQMGVQQADWVVNRLKGEGKVVMFTLPGARTVEERARTFKAVVSLAPNMEIVQEFQIDPTDPVGAAKEQMSNFLLRNPDVDAVWAGWDDPARGAAQGIKESGKSNAFVIGNDAGPDALEDIRGDSPLDGTIFVDYTTAGKIVVQELANFFDGKGVSARQLYVQQPIISRHLGNVPPDGETPPPVGYFASWPTSAESE